MFRLERAQAGGRIGALSLIGLVLIPLLVAGGFLWATWNSSDRLDRVQAAIVNNDEGVTLNKQFVPLGRQLAGGLVKGEEGVENFDWILTDDADAKAGMESGEYAAVVTIPKDFSKQATSFSKDETSQIEPATIDVQVSQIRGIADGVVAQFITAAATSALNTELTKQYLDNVYIGFNDTGKQFTTVADAAGKLADGATKLSDGLEQTSDGTGKLADGLGQLSTGASQLSSGVGQYTGGVSQLSTGLGKLADGTKDLPSQVRQLANGAQQAADGAGKLGAGGRQLDAGADKLVSGAHGVVSAVTLIRDGGKAGPVDVAGTKQVAAHSVDVAKGVGTVAGTMGAVAAGQLPPAQVGLDCPQDYSADQCVAWTAAVRATAGSAAQQLAGPAQQAGELAVAAGTTNGVLDAAIEGTEDQAGLEDFPAGVQKFADGLDTYTDGVGSLATGLGKLADGTDKLADGMKPLADGIASAASGAAKLAAGGPQLASGTSQLASGAAQSADGAQQLADGVVKLSDGGSQLADGSTKLADGLAKGAKQIPTYDQAKRTALSTTVATPVDQERPSALFADIANTTFLSVLALWLGGLASFLILRAVPSRVLTSSKPSWRLAADAVLPAAGIGVVQAVALTVSLQILLDLTVRQTLEMLPLLVLASLAFVVINHALVAWLGGVGRFVSVALGVLFAAAAITDAVPAALSALVPFLPPTPALEGARAIASGGTGALGAGGLLFIWLVAGASAGVLAVSRRRLAPAPAPAWAGGH
ncbi:YhgE/Pip domain-containing protein [Microlunatus ginsengisoli]|uniref:YhgE/Pip domain-containing protein n=1 Tax=Microlunatus ginsengisoli TaxID=363863 RepID=A0ABP7A1I3_9ACTN